GRRAPGRRGRQGVRRGARADCRSREERADGGTGEERQERITMRLLGDLAIRSSLVLLAGLVLHALLSGRSAALRHWVLAAAIFAAAAVVPLTLALPAWEISLPSPLSPPVSTSADL